MKERERERRGRCEEERERRASVRVGRKEVLPGKQVLKRKDTHYYTTDGTYRSRKYTVELIYFRDARLLSISRLLY